MSLARAWRSLIAGIGGLILCISVSNVASADPPLLSDPRSLLGDQQVETAVERQDRVAVAAGAGGYLVVWEDERPILTGFAGTAYEPLTGNGIDIYAARLDAAGQLVGGPIIIAQQGRDQTRPQVAWNESAQAWLVVWVSQRPDWYFFQDIVCTRVSAGGEVLDPEPILLRPENNSPANDYARDPAVASDGQTWAVVWEDQIWNAGIGYPNIVGKRLSADGTVLDTNPVVVYQYNSYSFGPIAPHLAWAGDEYLVVWERAGFYDIYGRRVGPALQPLGAEFVITSSGFGPRVASNGVDFLVSSRQDKAHRVTHAGVSLDPAGIVLPVFGGSDFRGPDVAWNGTHWMVVTPSTHYPDPRRVVLTRLTTDGAIVGTSSAVSPNANDQFTPAVASGGNGPAHIAWTEENIGQGVEQDAHGAVVDGNGQAGANVALSVGWSRQSYVRFAGEGNVHLAVFMSEGGGLTRIKVQRLDADGNPIDLTPVEVASVPELSKIHPDVAWNGSVYLVSWTYQGSVFARRLDASAVPVDPAPVLLLTDTAGTVGVGALGGDFLLAYPHTFSGDQRSLKGIVVRGSDLSIVASGFTIGGNFVSNFPRVKALDGRWLVAWEHRPTHDSPASNVLGAFVQAGGTPGPVFGISTSGYGFSPDLAVGNGRALIVWSDDANYNDAAIEGRVLNADGSFLGAEFVVADAPMDQFFPACGWDGEGFVAAWSDFRMLGEVDQMRGDIYVARIGWNGTVQDPGGFPITDGPLPEDLPAVSGSGGRTLVAFSELRGASYPEIQRIAYRRLGMTAAEVDDPVALGGWTVRIGPNPFRSALSVQLSGTGAGSAAGGALRFEVFSADGRLVTGADFAPGSSSLTWDGRDASGRSVPNGLYYTRLTSGSNVLLRKQVIRVE